MVTANFLFGGGRVISCHADCGQTQSQSHNTVITGQQITTIVMFVDRDIRVNIQTEVFAYLVTDTLLCPPYCIKISVLSFSKADGV